MHPAFVVPGLIAALSGFILVFAISLFGPRCAELWKIKKGVISAQHKRWIVHRKRCFFAVQRSCPRVFPPVRHKQKVLPDEEEDEVVPTNIPATLYEGGETTRSSKDRPSPILIRERPASMMDSTRSPTFERSFDLSPTSWTKERERSRANTGKT